MCGNVLPLALISATIQPISGVDRGTGGSRWNNTGSPVAPRISAVADSLRLTIRSTADIKLPAGKSDHVVWDDDVPGFGLRIRNGGKRTWIYRYRIGKQQRSITLGNIKSVPLAVARANAGQLEAKVRLGGDPALDKQTIRSEAENTVGALIDQYIDARQADWRPNSQRQVRRHLLNYARPLHRLPVTAVTQRDIASLLNDVANASGAVSSNRLRASLATFLGWVIRQGIRLPDGNVASYTQPRKETSRERVLSNAEIKAIWHACRDDDHGTIIKLLLLTGQRAAEIGELHWDEINSDQILLPSGRTKNKRPHAIPLSAPAKAILNKPRIIGRAFVFGRDDTRGFQGWGVSKKRLDQRITKADAPLIHWTVHDLRRTCATGMIELGVQPHIVEAVLNHVSGHRAGVAGIYNRATYDNEKREALERWAQHVLEIVGA
jgi:integrase